MKIRKNVINALEKILIGMYGFIFARVFLFMVGIDL